MSTGSRGPAGVGRAAVSSGNGGVGRFLAGFNTIGDAWRDAGLGSTFLPNHAGGGDGESELESR